MSNPTPQPPRFATALLKACCSPERLEEIEGDLCELFMRRTAREGIASARRRYTVDVCSISLRQLAVRGRRALHRPVVGAVEIYPLRAVACVAFAIALMSSEQAWAVIASQLLLGAYTLLEVTLYARVVYLTYKRWRAAAPQHLTLRPRHSQHRSRGVTVRDTNGNESCDM
jgi:putative ABC transport system permease protein